MRIEDALRLAQEAELDLVEVAAQARPPVCKLMDYGKFKYESAQKARESRRNQQLTTIKEQKLRPKIDTHDYETKKRNVVRFLEGGNKVKVTIMFRGREQSRPELGFRLLQRLAEDVIELGTVEAAPKQDGRNMTMVIAPNKKPPTRAQRRPGPRPEPREARSRRLGRGRPDLIDGGPHRTAGPPDAPGEPGASWRTELLMPKNKTHSGISKRVKVTGKRQAHAPADRSAPPARGQVEQGDPRPVRRGAGRQGRHQAGQEAARPLTRPPPPAPRCPARPRHRPHT